MLSDRIPTITMSETMNETEFFGHQLLRKSQTNPLWSRIKEFVVNKELSSDFKKVRKEAATGREPSEFLNDDREERL